MFQVYICISYVIALNWMYDACLKLSIHIDVLTFTLCSPVNTEHDCIINVNALDSSFCISSHIVRQRIYTMVHFSSVHLLNP